jgi:hypothetical protein
MPAGVRALDDRVLPRLQRSTGDFSGGSLRDQDDPDHVAGFTEWTERRNFDGSASDRRATSERPAR